MTKIIDLEREHADLDAKVLINGELQKAYERNGRTEFAERARSVAGVVEGLKVQQARVASALAALLRSADTPRCGNFNRAGC